MRHRYLGAPPPPTIPPHGDHRLRRALLTLALLTTLIGALPPNAATTAADQEFVVVSRGQNGFGELGDGTTRIRTTPVIAIGMGGSAILRGVTALSAGGVHTLALRTDGTVLAWGDNNRGQLGRTDAQYRSTVLAPTIVMGLDGGGTLRGVVTVVAGSAHSFALRSDGTVVAWGDNDHGQLGDGTTTERHAPVAVKGLGGGGLLDNVRSVATYSGTSIALRNDGSVVAWGDNTYSQLGDGTTIERHTPVLLRGVEGERTLGGIVAVAAGSTHLVALRGDGTVVAWGDHTYGQLGKGAPSDSGSNLPVAVVGTNGSGLLRDIAAISASGASTLALRRDGTVVGWGDNHWGQLGVGNRGSNNTPTDVHAVGDIGLLGGIAAIAIGGDHSLALRANGTVLTWGSRSLAALSSPQDSDTIPVPLLAVGGAGPLTGGNAISAGGSHDALLVAVPRPPSCGRFGDVLVGDQACVAIEGLAARGVIRGCDQDASPPLFCPDDPTARAQMAALIARAVGWDAENHATAFPDRCLAPGNCIDDALWRNVGTLQFHGVAKSYPDGTYNPFDNVLYAQAISFITRAMVKKGYWTQATLDINSTYYAVPSSSGHRLDLITYLKYAGPVPGTTSRTDPFAEWDQVTTRAWFARALWQALKDR